VDANQLHEGLKKLYTANPEVRVYVRGDKDALHGEAITALDRVRSVGIQKVAFEIKTGAAAGAGAPVAHTAVPSTNTAAPAERAAGSTPNSKP